MSYETYPIQGIPLTGGDTPTRQEITAWFANDENKYQVSLFMQAMTRFKEIPIEKRLSFFQIAGIHCYPVVDWDGEKAVTDADKNPKNPFPGFCNHNMVTFPTWHRPYMLLYEQAIYGIMGDLIDEWKAAGELDAEEEALWRSGASQFRLPYWDWARKQSNGKFALPAVCVLDVLDIVVVGGKRQPKYPNPLVGFRNPTGVPMGDESMGINAIKDDVQDPSDPLQTLPWSKCIGTSRFGINTDNADSTWINGVNNWQEVNVALNDPLWYADDGGSFAEAVGRMLSPNYFDCWESFASTVHNPSTAKKSNCFLSLEYIHNVVHNTVGGIYKSAAAEKADPGNKGYRGIGLGHMSDVPVAAFDPIFWFHHCNIDRLTAIWQTLNWPQWFDKPQEYDPPANGALRPFHFNTTGDTWTSDMCRTWTKLRYNYDDLVPSNNVKNPDGSINQELYLAEVRAHVDELYPPTHTKVTNIPGYVLENKFDDYVINIIYDRYALNGRAYAILFFLGDAPQNLSGYRGDKNFVGLMYTFSAPILGEGEGGCANCAKQKANKVLSKAQVPLTLPLLAKLFAQQNTPTGAPDAPGIPGAGPPVFDQRTVEEVLKESLNWKFVELGGVERPAHDFPNTEIAVLRGNGYRPDPAAFDRDDQSPLFSGYKKIGRATEDNPAGFAHPGTNLSLIHDDPEE